jgi:glutamate synthase (NADPH) small chain
MADPKGFLTYPRENSGYRPITKRIRDWQEVIISLTPNALKEQAARCMDCGVPFCHGVGCPLGNQIPEFNDLAYRGLWREAIATLHATNNFPEITGRVCPALCEAACTLNLNHEAVTIKHIELQIIERAFDEGWIEPYIAPTKSGKRVAVVGSGPSGLAAAQQLARHGHEVVVFERSNRIGGLLRYGIPDFKLEKSVLDRRIKQMEAEGVAFKTDVTVGSDISARYLRKSFDAICLCMGAGEPRMLEVPGAELNGVHLAMDYLSQQNRRVAGDDESEFDRDPINVSGKHVIVIGGGDTGSDCVGTAIRQGAVSVSQFEILPKPPELENPETPWPTYPKILRTSSSQQEGCTRRWSVLTEKLSGDCGHLTKLSGCEVDWEQTDNGWKMNKKEGTDFTVRADVVLIAMGFLHVNHQGLLNSMNLEFDNRGNIKSDNFQTSLPGIFAAGDTVRGASLVVHAINEGRQAATAINQWLKDLKN